MVAVFTSRIERVLREVKPVGANHRLHTAERPANETDCIIHVLRIDLVANKGVQIPVKVWSATGKIPAAGRGIPRQERFESSLDGSGRVVLQSLTERLPPAGVLPFEAQNCGYPLGECCFEARQPLVRRSEDFAGASGRLSIVPRRVMRDIAGPIACTRHPSGVETRHA